MRTRTPRASSVERQRLRRSASSARASSLAIAASSSARNSRTRARDSSAAFSSKDGFSVVAPTSVTVPSSITGRKASSCARLKRWISSTKSSVPCPVARRLRAASNTFLRSATPEKIAEICSKCRSVSCGEQARHGGLAGARRPPEHQRAEASRREQPRQRAVRAGEVVLADDLGERAGPQPVGERTGRRGVEAGGCEEVGHARINTLRPALGKRRRPAEAGGRPPPAPQAESVRHRRRTRLRFGKAPD